jgi:hypothetical protein
MGHWTRWRLEASGATDFVAIPCGTADEPQRTLTHLASLVTT